MLIMFVFFLRPVGFVVTVALELLAMAFHHVGIQTLLCVTLATSFAIKDLHVQFATKHIEQ